MHRMDHVAYRGSGEGGVGALSAMVDFAFFSCTVLVVFIALVEGLEGVKMEREGRGGVWVGFTIVLHC